MQISKLSSAISLVDKEMSDWQIIGSELTPHESIWQSTYINISLLSKKSTQSAFSADKTDLYYSFFHQSAAITSRINSMLYYINISETIRIPKWNEVFNYLMHYKDMVDIVPLICDLISARFSSSVQISLEVYHDPEIEDEYLVIFLRSENYTDELVESISDLGSQCQRYLIGKSGWLLVTTDFDIPR